MRLKIGGALLYIFLSRNGNLCRCRLARVHIVPVIVGVAGGMLVLLTLFGPLASGRTRIRILGTLPSCSIRQLRQPDRIIRLLPKAIPSRKAKFRLKATYDLTRVITSVGPIVTL